MQYIRGISYREPYKKKKKNRKGKSLSPFHWYIGPKLDIPLHSSLVQIIVLRYSKNPERERQ